VAKAAHNLSLTQFQPAKGRLQMASEVMKLTAQIVMSHASMTELTPTELIEEIKEIYDVLVSLECAVVAPESRPNKVRPRKSRKVKMKKSPEAESVQNEEGPVVGDPDYMDFMEHREG
jgi:predicted transcriptional regulator